MVHDKTVQSNTKPASDSEKSGVSLEADTPILSYDHKDEGADDPQVAELLTQLTAADGIAKGVEERLDGIIENLDLLLTALETGSEERQSSGAAAPDKSKETTSS